MRKYEALKKEDLQKIINECSSISEVLKKIGLKPSGNNHTSLTKYLEESNFDTKTLVGRSIYRGQKHIESKTLFECLTENGTKDSNKLKLKLFNSGIKQEKCEVCGITEWMGKKLTFELHHINGIHNDNRLENLIILCPNCHSQTYNFRGRNTNANDEKIKLNKLLEIAKNDSAIKLSLLIEEHNKAKESKSVQSYINQKNGIKRKNKKDNMPKRYCQNCGKELNSKQTKYCCIQCANIVSKKNKYSKEQLLILSKEVSSISGMRRKINPKLCDNTIIKWCKSYGIYDEVKSNFKQRSFEIEQYDLKHNLIKVWKNGDEIYKVLGFIKHHIQNCCRGKQKTSHGFIWRYKN